MNLNTRHCQHHNVPAAHCHWCVVKLVFRIHGYGHLNVLEANINNGFYLMMYLKTVHNSVVAYLQYYNH